MMRLVLTRILAEWGEPISMGTEGYLSRIGRDIMHFFNAAWCVVLDKIYPRRTDVIMYIAAPLNDIEIFVDDWIKSPNTYSIQLYGSYKITRVVFSTWFPRSALNHFVLSNILQK